MTKTNLLLSSYKKAVDMNIIISITDSKGTIIYVNNKFCEISKYSKAELLGQNHRIINSGTHPPVFFKELWATINNNRNWTGEIKNKAKDGSFYWVDTVILPIHKKDKKQYLSLRMDITKRKELEFKKQEYGNTLENLLFMISHEIRRPLTSILGLIELHNIQRSQQDLTTMFNYLKVSAEELDALTKDMNRYISKLKLEFEK